MPVNMISCRFLTMDQFISAPESAWNPIRTLIMPSLMNLLRSKTPSVPDDCSGLEIIKLLMLNVTEHEIYPADKLKHASTHARTHTHTPKLTCIIPGNNSKIENGLESNQLAYNSADHVTISHLIRISTVFKTRFNMMALC